MRMVYVTRTKIMLDEDSDKSFPDQVLAQSG